jgi:hypothetical protein
MSIAQVVVQSPEQVKTSSTELLSSQVWSPLLVVNRPLRLQLSPSIGQGALHGAWWPSSRDLTAEALDHRAGLLAHWDGDGGTNRTS